MGYIFSELSGQFIKYPGLTWTLHEITCVMIMVSGLDQSDELGVLYGGNSSVAPSLTAVFEGLTVQLKYLIIWCSIAHFEST